MGKAEYQLAWGYTQSLPKYIGGILRGACKNFPIYIGRKITWRNIIRTPSNFMHTQFVLDICNDPSS